jgi:hypothetical protein
MGPLWIPHVPGDIRAFDTLKRQGVPSIQWGIAVLRTIKKEIYPTIRDFIGLRKQEICPIFNREVPVCGR